MHSHTSQPHQAKHKKVGDGESKADLFEQKPCKINKRRYAELGGAMYSGAKCIGYFFDLKGNVLSGQNIKEDFEPTQRNVGRYFINEAAFKRKEAAHGVRARCQEKF